MVEELAHLVSCVESSKPEETRLRVQGACRPARALVSAFLMQKAPERPIICVAPDRERAEQFAREVSFFTHLFLFDEESGRPPRRILLFPPGLPNPDGITQASLASMQHRIRTLLAMLEAREPLVVVASQRALREKVPPKQAFLENTRKVCRGEDLDRDELAGFIHDVGYRRVPVVEAPGEYAVRGNLIDLFPLPDEAPCRIDFFGDTVESIRSFQPETQRSQEPVPLVLIPPASIFISRATDPEGISARVKERADFLDLPARTRLEFMSRIERGLPAHELPVNLPFFYPELWTLEDYLDEEALRLLLEPAMIRKTAAAMDEECAGSLARLTSGGRVVPGIHDLYTDFETFWDRVREGRPVAFSDLASFDTGLVERAKTAATMAAAPSVSPAPVEEQVLRLDTRTIRTELMRQPLDKSARGLAGFVPLIQEWIEQGQRVFLVCGSETEKVRFAHLLDEYDLKFVQPQERVPFRTGPAGLVLHRGELSQGFLLPSGGMVFIHEDDIFGPKVRKPRVREFSPAARIDIKELRPGDHVVHIDFGIGLYLGLETLDIRGFVNDYLHLQYASNDKLYLPVDRASRIQKYVSTEDLPPDLDKLGGVSWRRAKEKVKESVLAMAEELVSLYAVRTVKEGYSYSPAGSDYQEFEASFPFEETPHQMRAIEDVIQDMEKPRPMDRLVCGDVGYGKTEVAIRAAYKAVMDGRQVAVLVPTTVLAQQHYVSFLKRFEDHPVEIRMLSRFRSAKEQRAILEDLAAGKVDIIIGTHRLLQKDVSFRDLGLLVLDEEQRFGVRQKEALKKIRAEVDVLTLSATPIPRTLQMSMLGLRDLSTISTPPQDRQAIETYVVPLDEEIIRKALQREFERGGQAFFVHPRVSDIEAVAAMLRRIVPQARVAVGHGQMSERSLEKVMLNFVQGQYDVLVCTTIIESGLDIPNANTLLVHRADRFGLAQLYQLRGRVGRSERQAYAYLIVPDEDTLSDNARKRLEALYEFTELGSGFRIARYDMEIRGAGNLLGSSQSGQIRAVGYDLYMEFLEKAIREIKGEEVEEEVDPEIHLEIPAYLPQEYIEDSTQRLSFYKRLATAGNRAEVERIHAEVKDRYGPLPPPAEVLFELMHIKVRLRRLRIKEARLAAEGLLLSFDEHANISVDRILEWAAREPERLQLFPDNRLLVRFAGGDSSERLNNIQKILSWLEK